jgi:DNA polymerase I-like protein with 3'-5' exonuclease and polymerase domains
MQVTGAEREHMKRCCYGLLYGMGNSRLAKQLGMDHSQAVKMATEFKQGLQGVGKYFEVRKNWCIFVLCGFFGGDFCCLYG